MSKNKAAHCACYALLQSLELAYRSGDEILMYFIVDIPVSNGCSSIWVVVDRFMKISHFISPRDGQKTALDLIGSFLREI